MRNSFAELKRRHICRAAVALTVVVWLVLQLVDNVAPAFAAESPLRVFLLVGLTATEASVQQTADAIRRRLKERSTKDIEVYSDFLDLGRFQGPANEDRLVQFLGSKFVQVKPDIVIPISRNAVDFMLRHRGEFARGIPIVYCCAPALTGDSEKIPPDVPGVVMDFDWAGTLALAQRLQPNAKTLVIITGASDTDQRRDQEIVGELQPLLRNYETRHLAGLPYDELLKQVSRLPRDSIVLMRRVFVDGSGRARGPELAEDVSKASTAPVYSASATYLGSGSLGGRMDGYAAQGTKVADLALEILSGKDPSTLPHQTSLPLQYRVDARQLERWGFAESSLPPGTSVEFRQPTLWEQYRNIILLVLLAFSVLTGIIAALLIEIRKRWKAEEARKIAQAEADFQRKELTHMMRVAALGELSGGIAHELSQPLAAILANAQAAQVLLADKNRDKESIAEILEEIVQEDSRAGQVIQRLRKLLRKGEHQTALVSLNDLISSTLGLLRSELVNRNIKVETDLKTDLPPIMGDSVQLQQVLLNLMMNAMEAMASTPPSERTLGIGTRTTGEGYAEVSITDRGPGMSPDELKRLFEPFFTTKERGLGLGLSICSTIIRSHRGRLNLSNSSGGGVTAIVSVPLPLHLVAAS
jgi:signal transduction histidine kinase